MINKSLKKNSIASSVIIYVIKVFSIFIGIFNFKNKLQKKIVTRNFLKSLLLYKRTNAPYLELPNIRDIPVFIISFNNLTYLKQIIESLEEYNLTNIHIIDNASDYKPLLDYLKHSKHKVHFMSKNWGHKVLWDSHKFDEIVNNYSYVVTDPDIELPKDLPMNFLEVLYNILNQFNFITKIGLALRIDDIDNPVISKNVTGWENQFWRYKIKDNKYELYKADIDTTFALYRPGAITKHNFYNGIRVGGKFSARHLPWYHKCAEHDYYEKKSNKNITHISNWNNTGMF